LEDVEFSDAFCSFIQRAIPAVDAAEFLLFIADRPDLSWALEEALRKLRPGVNITDADAARYLEGFREHGLVEPGEGGKFRFKAATPELAAHVRSLAQAYEERPVTLIRVIYALRDSKIRTFADAFRLRKK
jgi:hypothetical protein